MTVFVQRLKLVTKMSQFLLGTRQDVFAAFQVVQPHLVTSCHILASC